MALEPEDMEMLAQLIQSGTAVAVQEALRELLPPEEGAPAPEPEPAPRPRSPARARPEQVIDPDDDPDDPEDDGAGRSPIILRGDSGVPTANDLLGHELAVLFRAGLKKFSVETGWDDVKGQWVRYIARKGDGGEAKVLEVEPTFPWQKAIIILGRRLSKLPPRGLRRVPSHHEQEMTQAEKDRVRAMMQGKIDNRFGAR